MNNYVTLFIVMVLWGLYPIFTHYFVLNGDPLILVSTSTFISSLPFLIKVFLNKKGSLLFSKRYIKPFLLIGFFAALGSMFFFVGTKLTSGVNSGLLLQVEPIYSLILGIILFQEVLDKKKFGAVLLMVLGAMVIIYKGFVVPNIGDILILLTTLMYQLSHSLVKKMFDKKEDISLTVGIRQLFSGVMLLIFAYAVKPDFLRLMIEPKNVESALYLGLSLPLILFPWYIAVKKMPLSVASSFLPVAAVFALLGSALFLKEHITMQHYLGFALIVLGMLWQAGIASKSKI